MEGELQPLESLVEELRRKGFSIEKVEYAENEARQCDTCTDSNDDFQFYQEGWVIEGDFFCSGHKEKALEALRQGVEYAAEKKQEDRKKPADPFRLSAL